MTSVGITGHQMREGIDWSWVRAEIDHALAEEAGANELWTSLATGADTIAAEVALQRGMAIKAVIPHAQYAEVFDDEDRAIYRSLLSRSADVVAMVSDGGDEDAYLAAGHRVADESDLLIVVWDGQPAAGKGGTGDIAAYAGDRGTRVIWLDTRTSKRRLLPDRPHIDS